MNFIPRTGQANQSIQDPNLLFEKRFELRRTLLVASEPLRNCLRNELTWAMNEIEKCTGNRDALLRELIEQTTNRCKTNEVSSSPDTPTLTKDEKTAFVTFFEKFLMGLYKFYTQGNLNPVWVMGNIPNVKNETAFYVSQKDGNMILTNETSTHVNSKVMDLEFKLRDPLPAQQSNYQPIQSQYPQHPTIQAHYPQPSPAQQHYSQPSQVQQQFQQPFTVQPLYLQHPTVQAHNQQASPIQQQYPQPSHVQQQLQQPSLGQQQYPEHPTTQHQSPSFQQYPSGYPPTGYPPTAHSPTGY